MRKSYPQFYTDDPDYALWIRDHEADDADRIGAGDAFSGGTRSSALWPERFVLPGGGETVCVIPVGHGPRAVPDADAIRERVAAAEDCDYVMLPDANAVPSPRLPRVYARRILETGGADLVYGDEDFLTDEGVRKNPYFKPDWSPDLLRSFNYLGPSVLYRRELLLDVLQAMPERTRESAAPGLFEGSGKGAKNHITGAFLQHLNLLCAKRSDASRILHVPEIVCHIRGRKVSDRYFGIREIRVEKPAETPKISIIIPSKDHFEYLSRCVNAILERTAYPDYEIVVVDNGSCRLEQIRIGALLEKTGRAKYIYEPMEFNFSSMCNLGAAHADGDFLVLLNDDVIVTQEDWLERMLDSARMTHVGAVGVRLRLPDGRLQHCGVGNMAGGPSHFLYMEPDDRPRAFGLNRVVSNALAVTAACLMVKKDRYEEAGGLDESLAVAYNDVDFCLNLREAGYFNVLRADVALIHDESASRGRDIVDEKKLQRLSLEQARLYEKHGLVRGRDPYYSPNLSPWKGDFSIRHDDVMCGGPELMETLPGTAKDLGLTIDRIDCGEQILVLGHIRGDAGGRRLAKTLRVYFRAGSARYLAADTKILNGYRGDGIYFAARMAQRYLTRSRSRIGVMARGMFRTYFEEAAPDVYAETRDYVLISFRNFRRIGGKDFAAEGDLRSGGRAAREAEAFEKAAERTDVSSHLDVLSFQRGSLNVRGWAFLQGELYNDRYTVQLAVRTDGRLCLRDLGRDERPDVARTFVDAPNLLYCGFHRRTFLPAEIDPGEAQLWLLFTNEENGSVYRYRIPRAADIDNRSAVPL